MRLPAFYAEWEQVQRAHRAAQRRILDAPDREAAIAEAKALHERSMQLWELHRDHCRAIAKANKNGWLTE